MIEQLTHASPFYLVLNIFMAIPLIAYEIEAELGGREMTTGIKKCVCVEVGGSKGTESKVSKM